MRQIADQTVARPQEHGAGQGGYWYAGSDSQIGPIQVLNLLRRYREAEGRMRARTREAMRMGETDLLALRFLIRAKQAGTVVRQKDLAQTLAITNASASSLVDRLVRDGYARRVAHPDDRRSVAVETTQHSDAEVRSTLGRMHTRMIDTAESLDPAELAAVAKFLTGLTEAVQTETETIESSTIRDAATG